MFGNIVNCRGFAKIWGGNGYPDLRGCATFLQTEEGVLVTVRVSGLPINSRCEGGIFAMHIHAGENCVGDSNDQFSGAKTHYNPEDCLHPYHAGDMPPLIGNNGVAYMSVLTNRFTISEILGKVIVIHQNKDDFTTQPSGNSGTKIGCGKIIRI